MPKKRAPYHAGKLPPPPPKCRLCKQVGGPWPNGDRPKTLTLASGCPRCGWCY